MVLAAVAAFVYVLVRRGIAEHAHEEAEGPREAARRLRRLLASSPALRAYLIANAFWEMALASLKVFIIVYLVVGLHYKLTTSSMFGYLVPVFTTIRPLIGVAVPFIALGGGAVMTLAYALLIPLRSEDEHGALTGFYSLSPGLGIFTGAILAGGLIAVTGSGPFRATQGFQAMWIVCAAPTFVSLVFVRRLERADGQARARA